MDLSISLGILYIILIDDKCWTSCVYTAIPLYQSIRSYIGVQGHAMHVCGEINLGLAKLFRSDWLRMPLLLLSWAHNSGLMQALGETAAWFRRALSVERVKGPLRLSGYSACGQDGGVQLPRQYVDGEHYDCLTLLSLFWIYWLNWYIFFKSTPTVKTFEVCSWGIHSLLPCNCASFLHTSCGNGLQREWIMRI